MYMVGRFFILGEFRVVEIDILYYVNSLVGISSEYINVILDVVVEIIVVRGVVEGSLDRFNIGRGVDEIRFFVSVKEKGKCVEDDEIISVVI